MVTIRYTAKYEGIGGWGDFEMIKFEVKKISVPPGGTSGEH